MNPEPITIEELLSALAAAESTAQSGDTGCTTTEIMEKTGRSMDWVRKTVGAAVKGGQLRPARKRVRTMADTWQNVPCYKLVRKS